MSNLQSYAVNVLKKPGSLEAHLLARGTDDRAVAAVVIRDLFDFTEIPPEIGGKKRKRSRRE